MKLFFLGVGEALDANQPNTSILVFRDNNQHNGQILLDCGFTVPHEYFKLNPDAETLEVLWISHFHGDHFMGVPLLILRFWELNRQEPLTIVGQKGVENKILAAVELAYPGLHDRLGFSLVFKEIGPAVSFDISGFHWQTALNAHSQPCLALRLEKQGKSFFYSGDGRPTAETLALAKDCDIIIHEAYRFQDETPGHGSIDGCIDFARKADVSRLVLLHIHQTDRQSFIKEIQSMVQSISDIEILLPESGDTIGI
jgi:ribonuclease BN (tRNA processing enzyme)